MKIATTIARVLLGLIFVVFGSNAFLHFLPMPPLSQGLAGDFVRVFFASGYVYVIGAMQIVSGLLLLIGSFVPLGLTILAAIIFIATLLASQFPLLNSSFNQQRDPLWVAHFFESLPTTTDRFTRCGGGVGRRCVGSCRTSARFRSLKRRT